MLAHAVAILDLSEKPVLSTPVSPKLATKRCSCGQMAKPPPVGTGVLAASGAGERRSSVLRLPTGNMSIFPKPTI